MDSTMKRIVSEYPSPTKLDKTTIKKIHELLPIPRDFEILWAHIDNFGGHPYGVVLTNRAIIIKAPKKIVDRENAKAYKDWSTSSKKEPKPYKQKYLYQMIPWDYFIPDEFICASTKDSNDLWYDLIFSGNTVYSSKNKAIHELFETYSRLVRQGNSNSTTSPIVEGSVVNTLGFENTLFSATYGSDNSKTGHGIYAEEAGVLLEQLDGDKSTVVGRNNAKSGPDKIVNGVRVQCKYCQTAGQSVKAAFAQNKQTGTLEYKYFNLDNTPMMLEVPKEQYGVAIEAMKKRIQDGQVPGVSNPMQHMVSSSKENLHTSKRVTSQMPALLNP